jgi:hypothetical protein
MLVECWEALRPIWETATSPTQKLFPSVPPMDTVRKDLKRATIARQDEEFRWADFHSLRYFFCTLLARKLPIQLVKSLMRHRDIRMTCNLYMDLGIADINEAAIVLPKLLGAEQQQKSKDDGREQRDTEIAGIVQHASEGEEKEQTKKEALQQALTSPTTRRAKHSSHHDLTHWYI